MTRWARTNAVEGVSAVAARRWRSPGTDVPSLRRSGATVTELGTQGTLWAHTVQRFPPNHPRPACRRFPAVRRRLRQLPEGIKIEAILDCDDVNELVAGAPMSLVATVPVRFSADGGGALMSQWSSLAWGCRNSADNRDVPGATHGRGSDPPGFGGRRAVVERRQVAFGGSDTRTADTLVSELGLTGIPSPTSRTDVPRVAARSSPP